MVAGSEQPTIHDLGSLNFRTLRWVGDVDGVLHILDQTLLPDREQERVLAEPQQVIEAIQQLAVRGAPAIGVAAAYGLCLALRGCTQLEQLQAKLDETIPSMRAARPTAINLHHMVYRMASVAM
jgi:methylthioribose-1-phosphate isomerase